MKKIVYLIEQPLDERNYDRFGIQSWVDRGWDVNVLDLTPWAHPNVWQKFIESGRKLSDFSAYFPVASKDELKNRCIGLEKIRHFIDLTGDSRYSIWSKKFLKRMGAIRVVCATGTTPESDVGQINSLVSKLGRAFARGPLNAFKRLTDALIRKIAVRFVRPGLVVVSGEKSMSTVGSDCQILRAHNFDYDFYLEHAKTTDVSAGEYVVFIDQDYCFHPDFIYQKIPYFVSPEKYFPVICNALNKISEVLNVSVQIAAHPRSTYRQRGVDYFRGYPIEYGKTANLIRWCKVVVCHNSTAIQLAVLFEKPVIFVTTDELIPTSSGESISKMASELGKSVINLDANLHGVDWEKELFVDVQKYAEYKKKYIKTDGSPELPFWEIVINHIEKAGRGMTGERLDQCVCVKDFVN